MKASLFLICIVIATTCAGADATFTPTTRTLFEDASFEVPADTLVVIGRISFFPTGNARDQAFMGTFTAERPARFVVFENLNYNAFLANQSFETFWESGPVTSTYLPLLMAICSQSTTEGRPPRLKSQRSFI